MLLLLVPKCECFDEESETFTYIGPWLLRLEHSLVSISKWESITKKPFLSKQEKTIEETREYVRCMSISPDIKQEAIDNLSLKNLEDLKTYIDDSMTATTFSNLESKTGSRRIITSELIYHWMIALHIPLECQKWHFNRLLTLIQVCNIESGSPKKRNQREVMSRNKALNDARRAKFNTSG